MRGRFFLHRLVWLSVLVSLGIGALVARGLWVAREDVLQSNHEANGGLAHTLAVGLEWALGDVDHKVQTMALMLSYSELGHDVNVHEVLQVIDSPLLLVNPQGQEVHSQVRSIATLDYTQRDFYLAFVRDGHQGVFVGEPQSLRPLGPPVLPVARAWRRIDGRLAGLVVGSIPLDGANTGLVFLFVRELKRRRQVQAALLHEKERMQAMAQQDALTGLSNRLHLQECAEQVLRQAQSRHVALLYLDLDMSPQHGNHFAQLLRQADAAMYRAKQGRRGRICICWSEGECQVLAQL